MIPSRDRRKFAALSLLATGVSVVGCYLAYKFWYSAVGGGNEPHEDKRKKCIVVTKGVKEGLDLTSLVTSGNLLLITPGLSFKECAEDSKSYNIIECDSWQGVWSCIRHLRPIELVLKEDDIPEGMPKDMQRYFTQITRL